ncbi:hypothetical protein SY88_10825 [Clostridiales bacterium PH28_bin88]|nr:hypothetical protein SY88_10825 [Clostridiales bacterium PH28_bin88]
MWHVSPASAIPSVENRPGHVRTIRVAGDLYFPPYEYVDENGVYKGFNVDIMRAIAIEKGLDLELVPMPWSEAVEALKRGEVDAIQGMKYSPARDQVFDFSDQYLESAQAIFVDRANRYIINLEDLKDTTVAVQSGDISFDLVAKIDGAKIIFTKTQEEGLEKVLDGEADAFVGNRLTGLYILQRKGQTDRLKIIGGPINPTRYGLAVLEGNQQLLALFNEGIKAIKAHRTYEKIYGKWFGELIEPGSRKLKRVTYGVTVALALAAAVALLTIRWNRLLHQEVRRRTEELDLANMRLLASDRLKEQILDNIQSGIITLNPEGKILSVSAPATALTGLGKQDVGKHYRDTTLRDLIDEERLDSMMLEQGQFPDRELSLPGGVILHSGLYPLKGARDNPEGAIISFRDITREKKLQEALHRQDKLHSLGQLVAGIAHEIRNPLTSIKTFVELIPQKFENPRFRDEVARFVPAEIERLNTLIHDLLEYSRPRSPVTESCLVHEYVEKVLLLFAPEIKKKRVAARQEVLQELRVMVDKHHFQQVLINLILNSMEAVEEGGRITITAGRDGPWGWVRVADDGSGINPEDLARVFEPFFSRKPNGTGLGLFVCYQFIKENGGDINITSYPGSGTTVELRLPIASPGGEAVG